MAAGPYGAAAGGRVQSILDRPVPKGRAEVSLSAFAFLFSELVQYTKSNPTAAKRTDEWEERLSGLGYGVGVRMLDLFFYRDKQLTQRVRGVEPLLVFIRDTAWKSLFGVPLPQDALSKNEIDTDHGHGTKEVYVVYDKAPILSRFICNPEQHAHFCCMSFTAGIIKGILDASEHPATVEAHQPVDVPGVQYIIDFAPHVMRQEARRHT
eukprot:TRINITY_DN8218_c0_g1_i1.p1 TRINITY_DN8218_c0_g1~~TRINITY_DN8218_c0_g1_i1.p1  ORF type:complete len:233 (+),score=56.69 TRINITY_DN8218_c0_g1_i1:75-701(+)